ncbi:dihydropteroate synthase, partial [Pseudomonas sp. MPR-R5A]
GYEEISVEEEIARVVPVIKEIVKEVPVPLSIDTYKAEVAKQAIEAGAHIINDIWGAKADPEMAKIAARTNVPIVLMHNRNNEDYDSFFRDCMNDLYESVALVKAAGVK